MYSLLLIFLLIPLIFSHFFARFGADFIIDNGIGHFESIKMHLFFALLGLATIEMILTRWKHFIGKNTKFWLIFGTGIAFFLTLAIGTYPHDTLRDLLLGVGEKQHGILLPVSLIWLGILLSFLTKKERKYSAYALLFSGICVAIVAIIEYIGYNIFTGSSYSLQGSWGAVRSTSTLGNPNYTAGFLLMLLPLVGETIRRGEKYIVLLILMLGIIATGSVIGISFACVYILFSLGYRLMGKRISLILPILLIIGFMIVYGLYHESDKWLSLTSRFILMKHTIVLGFDSVFSVIFGHGPDAILSFFHGVRDSEIDAYFKQNMIIDSSHNIFIDLWSFYGSIGLVGSIWYIISRWRAVNLSAKIGVILGLGFLSLNVFVITHLIVIVWYLAGERKTLPNTDVSESPRGNI